MENIHVENAEELQAVIEGLEPGDCVEADRLDLLADNIKETLSALAEIGERGADFISLREGIDTRGDQHAAFF